MPCTKCNSDFNLLNWKIKCGECEDKYCNRCLKKREGVLYCEKCVILLKRPPDRVELMELKPKDLQDYLKKHNVSTHGLVEKHELVDLFCNRHIPVRQRKGAEKITANFGCTLPNIRDNPSLSNFWDSIGRDLTGSSERSRTGNPSSQQEQSSIPRPPPRRKSPKSSPTSPTTAQFQTPSSSNGSTNYTTSSPSDARQPPASTSLDPGLLLGLGPDWVFVNTASSTEDISQQKTPEGSPLPKCPKLSELDSLEDIHLLTPKQLKILLSLNRVDFKGCVEKKELLEKAITLWIDSKKQREDCPEELEDLCKLCMDAPLDCVLLECGHIATCIECGKKLAECPICRQYVSRVVRTFKA